ncbi:hypothetical protein KJA14_01310 [Patescibacteria group bacterium]|nr:hypothetical protein [Patescibacteria group bacterium]
MKLDKKQFIFVLLLSIVIVGVLFVLGLNYLERRVESLGKITQPEKETPIQKGINFLLTTNEKFIGGTTFLIKKLNEICRDERLEDLWKRKIDEDIGDQEFLYRLYYPTHQYQDISGLENIPDLNTRLIAKATYCEKFSYKDVLEDINQIERDDSYSSAHLLLALAIIKEKGCYDQIILNALIDELVEDLTIIQDKEGESENLPYLCNPSYLDIYAERAAIIGYAGDSIKETWVENILRCQAENGSWFDSPHTTSLALWAIAQENKNCN